MLHILSGDAAVDGFKRAAVPGQLLPFREALIDGPVAVGIPLSEWIELRAQHLAEAYGLSLADCRTTLAVQEKKLSEAANFDEIALWFDDDLFCQVNQLYLISRFAGSSGSATISIISVPNDSGPGEARSATGMFVIGNSTAEVIRNLFAGRRTLGTSELDLASQAWAGYCSSDPSRLEKLLPDIEVPFPAMAGALRLHLSRFPSVRNGLGSPESAALENLAGGASTFLGLFRAFSSHSPGYGFGDSQVWAMLQRLASGNLPLVELENLPIGEQIPFSEDMMAAPIRLTEIGAAVLSNNADRVELNGIDAWVGGVHLSGDSAKWRWDSHAGKLVPGL